MNRESENEPVSQSRFMTVPHWSRKRYLALLLGAGALVMQGSLPSRTVAELALKQRLAAGTFTRSFAEVGGLVSYGPNATDSFQCASIS